MIVGEGTNEIQRNVIARQLIARGGCDARTAELARQAANGRATCGNSGGESNVSA